MPSLRQIPLEGAALREFYYQQVEKHDHGFVYPSDCQTRHYNDVAQNDSTKPPIQEPISDNVSSRNENSSSSASNKHAVDCFSGNIDHIYAYPDKSTYVYNNTKRGEEGYLSDTILDEVLNCDYTRTFETHDHRVHVPSSFDNRKQQNHQTAVNSRIGGTVVETRKRFKSHHAYTYHQRGEDKREGGHHTKIPPEHQHGMISSSASIISNAVNRHDEQNGKDVSFHDSSFFWEDEARCTNDITGSAALTEGTMKSCEPKRKKMFRNFEKHLEHLEAYKAKHGHCDVKATSGDDKPLGRWCQMVRQSMKKIKNNESSRVAGLLEDNIKRLDEIGFVWRL